MATTADDDYFRLLSRLSTKTIANIREDVVERLNNAVPKVLIQFQNASQQSASLHDPDEDDPFLQWQQRMNTSLRRDYFRRLHSELPKVMSDLIHQIEGQESTSRSQHSVPLTPESVTIDDADAPEMDDPFVAPYSQRSPVAPIANMESTPRIGLGIGDRERSVTMPVMGDIGIDDQVSPTRPPSITPFQEIMNNPSNKRSLHPTQAPDVSNKRSKTVDEAHGPHTNEPPAKRKARSKEIKLCQLKDNEAIVPHRGGFYSFQCNRSACKKRCAKSGHEPIYFESFSDAVIHFRGEGHNNVTEEEIFAKQGLQVLDATEGREYGNTVPTCPDPTTRDKGKQPERPIDPLPGRFALLTPSTTSPPNKQPRVNATAGPSSRPGQERRVNAAAGPSSGPTRPKKTARTAGWASTDDDPEYHGVPDDEWAVPDIGRAITTRTRKSRPLYEDKPLADDEFID